MSVWIRIYIASAWAMALLCFAAPVSAQQDESASAAHEAQPPSEHVQPSPPLDRERVRRMEAALQESSAASGSSSAWAGWLTIISGAVTAGTGAWVLMHHAGPVKDDSIVFAGTLALLTGGGYAAAGLFDLAAAENAHQNRLRCWQALGKQGQLSSSLIASLERELADEAAAGRRRRHRNGAMSIGIAAGGAALTVIAATGRLPRGSRTLAYAEGAVLGVFGVVQAIADLAGTSTVEAIWQRYRDASQTAPHVSALSLDLHPRGGHVQLSMSF